MYTLGSFFRILKTSCKNPAVSDEYFFNSLLDSITEAFRLKGRNGENLNFSKSRVSDLLRNKTSVPSALQGIVQRTDCKKLIVEIMDGFYEEMIDDTRIDQSVLMLKDQITSADNLISKQKEIITIENRKEFLSEAFILAIKTENTVNEPEAQLIWKRGTNALDLVIGDIFKFGFGNRVKEPVIIVIPVDDAFETRITKQTDSSCHPLVSEKTLHGKWLSRMYKCDCSPEVLDKMIKKSIIGTAADKLPLDETEREIYPIGTIASVLHCGKTFYLLAISHFSDDGVSSSTKKDIENSIVELLDYYNHYGQGYHMYLPLLGTGRSRAGLSYQESFDLIVSTLMNNYEKINGEISIVVLPEAEPDVSVKEIK